MINFVHCQRSPSSRIRANLYRACSICAVPALLFISPLSHAQQDFVGGEWRCNMKKVSLNTQGNKTIRIVQTSENITLVGDTGRKTSGRFSGSFELSTPGWEYGESARLGINVDGVFFAAADAIAKFNWTPDNSTAWNFLQWETGMICSTSAAALASGRDAMRLGSQAPGLR